MPPGLACAERRPVGWRRSCDRFPRAARYRWTPHARTTASLEVEKAGDSVLVHVFDDGPGFRPDDLERVFAPGHSGTDGHGLGLAVVRRIAAATGLGVR